MKLTNKLIAGFTAMAVVASNFAFVPTLSVRADSAEDMMAYEWAFDAGLTTMTSFSAFMPTSAVTREAAARFLVKGAEALGASPTSDQTCDYSDLADADQTLTEFINEGCEMGIFKAQAMFNPKSIMTRSQAELTIARTIYGMEEVSSYASDNGITEFAAARELLMADEVVKVEVPGESAVQRLHLILMLYRLADMDVVEPTDPTDPTDPVAPKAGSLDVSLSSMTPAAAEIPGASSGLPVAKFEFSAGSADVTVSSVKLLRKGFSDTDTLDGVALLTDTGRVSRARNENSTDGTVDLTLNNGGYVVKANTTVVFTVVATVGAAADAANDTFGFQVVSVASSAESTNVTSAISPLMRVSSQEAPEVDFEANGSSSSVKMGQNAAELAKFKITNNNSDQTVTIKSLTFEEVGSVDENTELRNFALFIDGVQFGSTVASTSNKYVTFSNAAGKVINTNNNVKLVIKADVIGGAAKTVRFELDNELDFIADGSKFGPGVGINNTAPIQSAGFVNIDAGEVTIDDVDAVSDKMREDKDDIVLGKIRVTNVAGKALELQQFGVKATLTAGGALVGGNAMTLANLFDNFELYNESNGATYELDLNGTVFEDNDLNIALAQGTTTFAIRADTANNITNFDAASVKLDLSAGALTVNGGLYIIETEDDTQVTDITPSALSWKTVKGSEAGATVALTPLSNVSRVRGSNDVVALQFTVEADESSALMIDEAKVYVTANGAAATNQQVKEVALYKGTVDAANLLDKVSGSQLAAGVATFNGFNTTIAADATQAYVVTVSIVDGADAVLGSPIRVALDNNAVPLDANLALSVEDDDNDTVDAAYPATVANRNIAVTNAGSLTVTADANNVDNKDPKTILAGTSMKVFSVDVQASNENVDVEEVVFETSTDLSNAVSTASLYLGDTLIATNTNADITASTITFKNLTNLIVPQSTQELRLELNTATIGFEKVGETLTAVTIDSVEFNEVEGVDSGKEVIVADLTTTLSQDFAIVPVKVTASVAQALSASNAQAKLTITIDRGSNTVDANNAAPQVLLTDLVFSELGNNTDGYKIYKEGNAGLFGTISSGGVFAAGTMPTNDLTISTSATYVIVPTGTVDSTYSPVLAKNGVEYDVAGITGATGLTNNAVNDVELGSRTY